MNKTSIEWALNPDGTPGYTWNPITGCLNGCEYCYARKLANTRLRERYLANKNVLPNQTVNKTYNLGWTDPFYPRFWEDRLRGIRRDVSFAQSRRWGSQAKARGIFVCDMSDLFGIGIPEIWTKSVMDVIKDCPTDRFYLLTKQPQNLIKFSPFPDNCWVGVSATNSLDFEYAVYSLRKIEARIKYISVEPCLNKIYGELVGGGIDWVIIGSQTKPYKPPKIEWVKEIVQACDKAGIPVFLKDNLNPLLTSELHKGIARDLLNRLLPFANPNGEGWEGKLRVLRQEMPNA